MAQDNKGAPKRKSGKRNPETTTMGAYKDIAKMAAKVAEDEGLSVAELIDPLLRGPLKARYAKILERELKGLDSQG